MRNLFAPILKFERLSTFDKQSWSQPGHSGFLSYGAISWVIDVPCNVEKELGGPSFSRLSRFDFPHDSSAHSPCGHAVKAISPTKAEVLLLEVPVGRAGLGGCT